ncbi:MAG: GntR family transcriptional regulator [Lachnospiraceae bacterium]|jgi:DNA-binding GntR family transcriptional regulator|nr:GntR family transcriptional regulator [Lachnospiraceae bacterium]MCR4777214.1 GntR family transcriptional regulator [Lachnospiraceae bacterium]
MHDFTVNINEYLPLRDVVFQTLRRAILMGELEPGERLMELALTEKLGVSRTPVREAIRMLEKEGLVEMIPRKGAAVSRITEKDLQDVLEVRCALEELAVGLACERMTEDDIEKLEECTEGFSKKMSKTDVTELAEADVKFHDIIFLSTGNGRLIQMLNNLREQMYRYRVEYLKDGSSHEQLLREHNEIIACLKEKNADAAKAAIREHIYGQVLAVSKMVRNEDSK